MQCSNSKKILGVKPQTPLQQGEGMREGAEGEEVGAMRGGVGGAGMKGRDRGKRNNEKISPPEIYLCPRPWHRPGVRQSGDPQQLHFAAATEAIE